MTTLEVTSSNSSLLDPSKKVLFSKYELALEKNILHPGEPVKGTLRFRPEEMLDCFQIEMYYNCTSYCDQTVPFAEGDAPDPNKFYSRSKVHYTSAPKVVWNSKMAGFNCFHFKYETEVSFSLAPLPATGLPPSIALTDNYTYRKSVVMGMDSFPMNSSVQYRLIVKFGGLKRTSTVHSSTHEFQVNNFYSSPAMLEPIKAKLASPVPKLGLFSCFSKGGSIEMKLTANRSQYGPGDRMLINYRVKGDQVEMSRIKSSRMEFVRYVKVLPGEVVRGTYRDGSKNIAAGQSRTFSQTLTFSAINLTHDRTVQCTLRVPEDEKLVPASYGNFMTPSKSAEISSSSVSGKMNGSVNGKSSPASEKKQAPVIPDCVHWRYEVRLILVVAGGGMVADTTHYVALPLTIGGRSLDAFDQLTPAEQQQILKGHPAAPGGNALASSSGAVGWGRSDSLVLLGPMTLSSLESDASSGDATMNGSGHSGEVSESSYATVPTMEENIQ